MKLKISIITSLIIVFVTLFILTILYPKGTIVGGDLSYLFTLLFTLLIFVWGISMVYRIQYNTQKKLVLILFILFYFWIMLRFIKWLPQITKLSIYIDYLYYIPMMIIPNIFMIFICETFLKIKYRKIIYIIFLSIGFIFILFSLTNDLHHLVYNNFKFTKTNGDPAREEISYSYGIIHYMAMIYIIITALFSFLLFAIGAKKQISFRQIILPLYVLIIAVAYYILYFLNIDFIKNTLFLKDLAFMSILFLSILLEVMLVVGLIQNNGKYRYNFKKSSIPMCIYDENNNELYYSNNFDKNSYINKSNDYVYRIKPIGNLTLVVEEDVKEIRKMQDKINLENNDIKKINEVLQKVIEITKNTPSLSYRLDLIDEIDKSIKTESDEVKNIINSLPNEINNDNKDEVSKNLSIVSLLLGFMKQKCMLLLELKTVSKISYKALDMLLNVITHDLYSAGFKEIKYNITSNKDNDIHFILNVIELINKTTFLYLFKDLYMFIIVDNENNKAVIEIDCDDIKPINIFIPQTNINVSKDETLRIVMEVSND